MNLTLLTHYLPTERENYQLIADMTLPGREAYCARFGYQHLVHSGSYHDSSLYWAIQRLHLLYDYLYAGPNDVDAVWVLNPQSLITSYRKAVTDYLDPYPDRDFFVTKDINGVNMASFIVRKTDWTKRYLECLMELAPRIGHCWHEQQAVIETHEKPQWACKIKLLDHPSINSYLYSRLYSRPATTPGQWEKGHLILSLPGTSFADRLRLIPEMLGGDNIDL
jgi:hypothetical protein